MSEYIGGDLIRATSPRAGINELNINLRNCIALKLILMLRFYLVSDDASILSCYIPECEKLLQRMLVIDPEKRLTMKEITNNKWMKLDGDDEDFQKLIADSLEPIDEADEPLNEMVMQHMEGLGIDRESTVEVRSMYKDNNDDDDDDDWWWLMIVDDDWWDGDGDGDGDADGEKTRGETFKFGDLVWLILEIWG